MRTARKICSILDVVDLRDGQAVNIILMAASATARGTNQSSAADRLVLSVTHLCPRLGFHISFPFCQHQTIFSYLTRRYNSHPPSPPRATSSTSSPARRGQPSRMYPISDLTAFCRRTTGDVPPKLVVCGCNRSPSDLCILQYVDS